MLQKLTAVVTGGGGGIGKATAFLELSSAD
jgi:NAD(P)-dependent dehydrogenase (short-subunit alcohol dehydrogenase family)